MDVPAKCVGMAAMASAVAPEQTVHSLNSIYGSLLMASASMCSRLQDGSQMMSR